MEIQGSISSVGSQLGSTDGVARDDRSPILLLWLLEQELPNPSACAAPTQRPALLLPQAVSSPVKGRNDEAMTERHEGKVGRWRLPTPLSPIQIRPV